MTFRKKYKDSVFTDLFGSDRDGKKNFLELYNALAGTDYKLEEVSLERKVIEQALYKTFNNDVSWEIDGKLIVLVEHQSTVNEKDGSKLELVVKVKNCSDSKMLPITGNCDILKEYCQFIEIVEHTYNKSFPKSSFKKAIEKAISQGILSDYLDRKSREVINMLCAKYDYKMDIAVKQEEAYEDGMNAGVHKNAVENAKNFLKPSIKTHSGDAKASLFNQKQY